MTEMQMRFTKHLQFYDRLVVELLLVNVTTFQVQHNNLIWLTL